MTEKNRKKLQTFYRNQMSEEAFLFLTSKRFVPLSQKRFR